MIVQRVVSLLFKMDTRLSVTVLLRVIIMSVTVKSAMTVHAHIQRKYDRVIWVTNQ